MYQKTSYRELLSLTLDNQTESRSSLNLIYESILYIIMGTLLEKETERLNHRLQDELVDRASDAALAAYDAAVDDKTTTKDASTAARKVYEDILAPWGL